MISEPRQGDNRRLWLEALSNPGVWSRACKLGLGIGLLQAIINQGDLWLSPAVSPVIIAKSLLTPLITLSVAVVSAAATYVEKQRHHYDKEQA